MTESYLSISYGIPKKKIIIHESGILQIPDRKIEKQVTDYGKSIHSGEYHETWRG